MTDQRPLIGLTGRRKKASQIVGTPQILHDLEGDWFYADYARGVLAAGGLPVNLPLDADPTLYLDRLDGVLLSGGADIDPGRYGASSETDEYPPEPERDDFELSLFSGALDRELPVLGICRGLQLVNIGTGGTLHQDVPVHAVFDAAPATLSHGLSFASDSVLGSIYDEDHQVNSLHHQTIRNLGDGLRVTATSPDESVEGIEHQDLPIVAVQWHPEMMASRDSDPIFTWFVQTAAKRTSGG